MTRLSSSFVRDRQLILVEAEVVGPTGRTTEARLVLDTGAAATTLTPQVIEKVGYTRRDGFKKAKVHTAIGEEHGYWLRVAEFTVLGVATPDFALTVFPLGHKDIDGLVGMNFLRHFNFEVRPADRQILVELVKQR
ncbi:MAG TPA: retropepsin-like aspartic protease [Kofleriaceae bacterium]|nr:retropepsin-like aspartic protease [Kofleriaceae bacterium]